MSRAKLTLEITCSNPACPTPEKVVVLTGRARSRAVERGLAAPPTLVGLPKPNLAIEPTAAPVEPPATVTVEKEGSSSTARGGGIPHRPLEGGHSK